MLLMIHLLVLHLGQPYQHGVIWSCDSSVGLSFANQTSTARTFNYKNKTNFHDTFASYEEGLHFYNCRCNMDL